MKHRNVRWLLASVVAVVSIGAGVSAAASQDSVAGDDEVARTIKLDGKQTYSVRSFGIRW